MLSWRLVFSVAGGGEEGRWAEFEVLYQEELVPVLSLLLVPVLSELEVVVLVGRCALRRPLPRLPLPEDPKPSLFQESWVLLSPS